MNKGYTLIEIIVVLVIVGVLLTVGITVSRQYIEKAKHQQLKTDCRAAVQAAAVFFMEKSDLEFAYVTPSELDSLLTLPGEVKEIGTKGNEVIHLRYAYDGYNTMFCRDYKTCKNHKKIYTITRQP